MLFDVYHSAVYKYFSPKALANVETSFKTYLDAKYILRFYPTAERISKIRAIFILSFFITIPKKQVLKKSFCEGIGPY